MSENGVSYEPYSVSTAVYRLGELLKKQHLFMTIFDGTQSFLHEVTIPGSTSFFKGGISMPPTTSSEKEVLRLLQRAQQLDGHPFSIAAAGNLHAEDPLERIVYTAYHARGKPVWIAPIVPSGNTAMERETAVAADILTNAFLYLQGKQNTAQMKGELLDKAHTTEYDSIGFEIEINRLKQQLKNYGYEKIVTAESCTGGFIARLLQCPGYVAYDEAVKSMLGVASEALSHGRVYSKEAAIAMTQGIYQKTRADLIVSTTGTMDTLDTRYPDIKPGSIFCCIMLKGQPYPWNFQLPIEKRSEMKKQIAHVIFDTLFDLLALQSKPASYSIIPPIIL